MRIEPDSFVELGEPCLWLTQPHQRLPTLEIRASVVAIERDRLFELHFGFAQPDLISPEYAHRKMRIRALRIAFASFKE